MKRTLLKNRLKEFRNKAGLTQQNLAKTVRLSQGQISKLERGHTMSAPTLMQARDLGRALRCKLETLFSLWETE